MSDDPATAIYEVEVGYTKTGILNVKATSEAQARERAKEAAMKQPGSLEVVEKFTNGAQEVRNS